MTSPAYTGAPPWFSAALAAAARERTTTFEGTSIAYRVWGDPADRNIVLVHGGAAHSHWWDHIAPLLTKGWQVVSMDMSGHGDSGRRDHYSLDTSPHEVMAVVTDAGVAASTVVIGHSIGGLVTLRLASLAGSQIAGAVAIDSPVRDITPEDRAARQHRAFGPLRVYPTREAAVAVSARFLISRPWSISGIMWPPPRSAQPKAAGRGSSTRASSPGIISPPSC